MSRLTAPEFVGRNQEYLSQEWRTPGWLYQVLDAEFGFTLDPCCSGPDSALCGRFYTPSENGLLQSWRGETVFMNPPYSNQLVHWLAKAALEGTQPGTTVVGLFPARTGTLYFREHVAGVAEIRFITGRIQFVHPEGKPAGENPAYSCIAVWSLRHPSCVRWVDLKDYKAAAVEATDAALTLKPIELSEAENKCLKWHREKKI